jgi:branched-chain amino acid transport system permease protein
MTAEILLQSVISGILMGFVYALIAAGLSLIFGLMEIVNFAHGEFLMLAMFGAFWGWALWSVDPLLSLPLTAAALFLLGVLTYKGIIRWILGGPMLAQIFATFGLGVFLRNGAQFAFGVDFLTVQDPWLAGRVSLGGLYLGLPQVAASVVALVAFGALYLFLSRSETGVALTATAQDRFAARRKLRIFADFIKEIDLLTIKRGYYAVCLASVLRLLIFIHFLYSTILFGK